MITGNNKQIFTYDHCYENDYNNPNLPASRSICPISRVASACGEIKMKTIATLDNKYKYQAAHHCTMNNKGEITHAVTVFVDDSVVNENALLQEPSTLTFTVESAIVRCAMDKAAEQKEKDAIRRQVNSHMI